MRYTEARLKKIGEEMMQDLYKETVDFQNNFDDTLQAVSYTHLDVYKRQVLI